MDLALLYRVTKVFAANLSERPTDTGQVDAVRLLGRGEIGKGVRTLGSKWRMLSVLATQTMLGSAERVRQGKLPYGAITATRRAWNRLSNRPSNEG